MFIHETTLRWAIKDDAKMVENQDISFAAMKEHGEKTFLGKKSLSSRFRFFLFFGLAALGAVGGVFYFAHMKLATASGQESAAKNLSALAAQVEQETRQIRATQINYLAREEPRQSGGEEKATTDLLDALGSLYKHPDTGPIREHITTMYEGVSQQAEVFNAAALAADNLWRAGGDGLMERLSTSGRKLETKLAELQSESLKKAVAALRLREKNVSLNNEEPRLGAIKKQRAQFAALLLQSGLSKKNQAAVGKLMDIYQDDFAAFAEARAAQHNGTLRIGEIFAYIAPSLEGLLAFSENQTVMAQRTLEETQALLRIVLPATTTSAIVLLLFTGLVLIRSITSPLEDVAWAAGRLAAGEESIAIAALGNEDEIGRIARALGSLQIILSETRHARKDFAAAKALLKKEEETARDAETRAENAEKSEEEARAMLAEATAQQSVTEQPEPLEAEEQTISPTGPISSISHQVAQSSQAVSSVAYEAERTGSMIRGIMDSIRKLIIVEDLLGSIIEQTDFLVFNPSTKDPAGTNADDRRHLVLLSSGQKMPPNPLRQPHENDAIGQRFDAIRTTSGKASGLIKDISATLNEVQDVAVEIAAASSTEALAITSELLKKSEYLRGMLDDLVTKLDISGDDPASASATLRNARTSSTPEKA
jgi:methyl-accepting chemotaxis protein